MNVTCQIDTETSGSEISENSTKTFKLQYIKQEFPLSKIDCVSKEYYKFKEIFSDENLNSCEKYNSKFIHLIFKSHKRIKKLKFIDNSNQHSNLIYDIQTEKKEVCKKENDLFNCEDSGEFHIKLYFGEMSPIYELCEIQVTE